MKNLFLIIPVTVLTSLTVLLGNIEPSKSQPKCTPLSVIGGTGTSVSKSVSGGVVRGNNFNTDFAVPSGSNFKSFVATVRSDSTRRSDLPVEMFLKYSDNTNGRVFQGNVALEPNQGKQISGSPRVNQQPFQVNLKIGSVSTMGFSYTISVVGCK